MVGLPWVQERTSCQISTQGDMQTSHNVRIIILDKYVYPNDKVINGYSLMVRPWH